MPSNFSVALADDEQVPVLFNGIDDRENPTGPVTDVTMTSSDETIAKIGVAKDGATPAIVAAGPVGACTVACARPDGSSATIAVAIGTSAPVGFAPAFGAAEKQ